MTGFVPTVTLVFSGVRAVVVSVTLYSSQTSTVTGVVLTEAAFSCVSGSVTFMVQ